MNDIRHLLEMYTVLKNQAIDAKFNVITKRRA